jgi:elongation factor P hydroxylase
MNSDDDLISDSEHDQIASDVFDEIQRIYDFDYKQSYNLNEYALPWTTCTTCFGKHRCVVSILDMSAECAQCAFKRRVREEEARLKEEKLRRRAELLKDIAEL